MPEPGTETAARRTARADRDLLARLFGAAVAAADPRRCLAAHLPQKPRGRTVVIGAGKGAAQMAAALEELWDGPLGGVVVTRYGYAAPCRQIRVLEAGHPVPDAAGARATEALFGAVSGLGEDDLVIALICGGGSALLPGAPEPLTLADEIELNTCLLASGAPISAMNAIRRQVSRVKGGRLAQAAHPARVVSLVVSDVPGDDPAEVASGPTVPGTSGLAAARAAIDGWRIDLPPRIRACLDRAPAPAPLPDDPAFARDEVHLVASSALSLAAAHRRALAEGIGAVILSDALEGEAREVGKVLAAIATGCRAPGGAFARPVVLLSGGETTVTLGQATGPDTGQGRARGGRNGEFLLSFALGIEGQPITALAADTDGIDGSETNAGAFCDGDTARRLRALEHDPAALLARHDSWGAFSAAGELFEPGPTGTNVNDFRAILVR
ncbi:glycerate kinase type-2 family protein [Celeribacter indicus]|uniref:Hydroxypyruvate reductase n=1 Tax=Celeribacter indicus TaxID=1208324 RepID=A0A0B5DWM3_9RHOB|nr:glycerate kinase [Celeribacter indicus]AJE47818.1 hydroxypyruvate reductase [Celeribacter indicus]SDW23899.1 hydroxypyruvate reductase [Celeribacter indicus]